MRLIDTHCHLHFPDYDTDRDAMIARARSAGVEFFVNVGTDPATNERARNLASNYPFMKHSVGLHPHSAHEADEKWFSEIEEQVADGGAAAIGEIGLDYFKSEGDPDTQKKVFRRMVRLAKKSGLPIIVHSRNAFDDTHAILSEEKEGLKGVMHCFSYDEASMRKMVELGMFISFTCNITYKKADALLEAAKKTPLDRIVFETDSPYLSPQSKRGTRNEPANLAEMVPFLAAARGMGADELAAKASDNAARLFGLAKK
jgi:TatD DNase family protein